MVPRSACGSESCPAGRGKTASPVERGWQDETGPERGGAEVWTSRSLSKPKPRLLPADPITRIVPTASHHRGFLPSGELVLLRPRGELLICRFGPCLNWPRRGVGDRCCRCTTALRNSVCRRVPNWRWRSGESSPLIANPWGHFGTACGGRAPEIQEIAFGRVNPAGCSQS